MLEELKSELEELGNPSGPQNAQRVFKTGPGQYAEGDIFLGISSPNQRKVANKYDLSFEEIQNLLNSEIHEHRLVGLFILIRNKNKEGAFRFYLKNISRINNWDLVDLSAPNILGNFLLDKKKDILYALARSENLWEKRISIISTFAFIDKNQFDDSIAIAEILLGDSHDLIHKAVGWMLREVGKKNQKILEDFLKKHYSNIPRTTLRYAIEKFEEGKRKKYLKGKI
jgi:3-methyladenine DNA glycosylase AlkD